MKCSEFYPKYLKLPCLHWEQSSELEAKCSHDFNSYFIFANQRDRLFHDNYFKWIYLFNLFVSINWDAISFLSILSKKRELSSYWGINQIFYKSSKKFILNLTRMHQNLSVYIFISVVCNLSFLQNLVFVSCSS